MIRPIILIGTNRSGTKWVSNILCRHEDVTGVQSERSRGIIETNMFGVMQDKFDLSYPEEYVGLLELWAGTEFFKNTNIDKGMFYGLIPRPRNALVLFELLMCEFARRNGKSYWLQKTSPLRASEVLRYFRNARIVIIRRNLLDTLKSTWVMQSRDGRRRVIRSTFAYVRQHKIMNRIAKEYSAVELDYDSLRSQTAKEIVRLCAELGLNPDRISPDVPYRRNTSFANAGQRGGIMSAKEELIVKLAAGLFRLVPLDLINAMSALKARLSGRRVLPLVSGTFGPLVDRLGDRSTGVTDS